jgi:hypothetical protein
MFINALISALFRDILLFSILSAMYMSGNSQRGNYNCIMIIILTPRIQTYLAKYREHLAAIVCKHAVYT